LEYREPARFRSTFHTSPQAQQRQYESTFATLLVVVMSCDRQAGQRVGAACSTTTLGSEDMVTSLACRALNLVQQDGL
jgi:hypothetical protein